MIVRSSTADVVIHSALIAGPPGPADSGNVNAMTTVRRALGAYGERLAAQHLLATGLRLAARNWRCGDGEIDIIAWDGDVLVFCEVKTRRGIEFGTPAESIVPAKARRLRRLAAQWLQSSAANPREVRFDVIEVRAPRSGTPRVEHIKGAF